MIPRARAGAPLLLLAAVPLAILLAFQALHAESRSRVKTWTWSFQADTLGQEPQHAAVFGGKWEVALDESKSGAAAVNTSAPADSAVADSSLMHARPRVLRQADSDDGVEFHYLQFKKPVVEDLIATVRFRVLSGEIDPTAGLLFQLDPKGKSGYLLRVSGAKSRLIAHYLLYGKRRDLRSTEIPTVEPGIWHSLSISRKGSVMTASYDGVEQFRVRDERFRKGTVGLWTEDDTVVEFADLTVSTN